MNIKPNKFYIIGNLFFSKTKHITLIGNTVSERFTVSKTNDISTLRLSSYFLQQYNLLQKRSSSLSRNNNIVLEGKDIDGRMCVICHKKKEDGLSELFKVCKCPFDFCICSEECYQPDLKCPICKGYGPILEKEMFSYDDATEFIDFMGSLGEELENVNRSKENKDLFIFKEGEKIVIECILTSIEELLILNSMGCLMVNEINLTSLRICKIEELMTSEDVEKLFDTLSKSKICFQTMWGKYTIIDSHWILPYLSSIEFPSDLEFIFEMDIDNQAVNEMDPIDMTGISNMTFNRKSYLSLPKMAFSKSTEYSIHINIEAFDNEEIEKISDIHLGTKGKLYLNRNAYILLSKIRFEKNKRYFIQIDTFNLSIEMKEVNKIDKLILRNVEELYLMGNAYLILPKIKFYKKKRHFMYINPLNFSIKEIEKIRLNKLTKLHLNNKAFLLLPRIRFSKKKWYSLSINTLNSIMNIEEIKNMNKIILRNVNDLYIERKAFMILSKIDFVDGSKVNCLRIMTEESDINREIIEEIGEIRINCINKLFLKKNSTFLLLAMVFLEGNSIDVLEICSDFDTGLQELEMRKVLEPLKSVKNVRLSKEMRALFDLFDSSRMIGVLRLHEGNLIQEWIN
eukprot:GHVP01056218.1.p1 GENE.GHVP01056218.1~~GHVP01056218.1.p1  ORF type:complete len:626 (-),score=100.34 GHVP01056218.1:519-2396(-)